MYGTVARMRVKPGMESKLIELGKSEDSVGMPGYVGQCVYKLDDSPDTYMVAVVFESREAYRANAESSEQHQRYLEMRELLAEDPEWFDGEVVHAYMRPRS
ncbi:MAG TPA: antibiotic biosynthesis monooxygenase family protein [Chloroflexota bacterium]|nr:antibiotic biosynthesis monooxygenase family protein [Chloroflexota bacterium]